MKKHFYISFLLLFTLALTSCVDYVQSISYKNGKYQMYYKVTLSKMLFAMMDEDPEEIFEDFDEEEIGELPANASITPVNTDLEVSAEFKFNIDPKTTDETEKSFLPTISETKCYIPFLLGENESIADSVGNYEKNSEIKKSLPR